MTRKNKHGHYIIAAGEVAEYALCPESWRLGIVERKERGVSSDAERGVELHDNWAADFLSIALLYRSLRTLFLLFLVAFVVLVLRVLF